MNDVRHRRPIWVDGLVLALAAAAFLAMLSLGNWQMARLAWKTDLIERVERLAFAEPVAADLQALPEEYTRVSITGVFQHGQSLKVKALTDLGPGHWLLTPMTTQAGSVWINRGFVPPGTNEAELFLPMGDVAITGLVRHSVPGGTLLERNRPDQGRWVSVDVNAMSIDRDIAAAAFYVDVAHSGPPAGWPRGGLTRLEFRNSHLSYALTWYAMAALFAAAMGYVIWDRRRASRA